MNKKNKPATTLPSHSLIGRGIHTLEDDGKIIFQGEIIDVDGDVVLVQLFEWMHGTASRIEKFTKSYIYSSSCILYANNLVMQSAYEDLERQITLEWRAAGGDHAGKPWVPMPPVRVKR